MGSTVNAETTKAELVRRHKAAATTVLALIVATILLCAVALVIEGLLVDRQNPVLDMALRITILILGLGAIALRRTRFSAMRLQDIGGLEGASGLLRTLERTTLLVALLGAGTVTMGFLATLATGNSFYTYGAGLVGLAILLYAYPIRRGWERTLQLFTPTDESAPS